MGLGLIHSDHVERASLATSVSGGGSINVTNLNYAKNPRLREKAVIAWSGFSGGDSFTIEATLESRVNLQMAALLGLTLLSTASVEVEFEDNGATVYSATLSNTPGARTGFTRNLFFWVATASALGTCDNITIVRVNVTPGTASGTMEIGRLFAGRAIAFPRGGDYPLSDAADPLDDVARGLSGIVFATAFGRRRRRGFSCSDVPAAGGSGVATTRLGAYSVQDRKNGELSLVDLGRLVGRTREVIFVPDDTASHDDTAIYGYLSEIGAIQDEGADKYGQKYVISEAL